jgi:histidinol phosphatase-like enzyme
MLEAEGVFLSGVYFCPHTPDAGCECRKPKPGLVYSAAKELGFDPEEAFVVGDKPCDIDLGRRVGATTFLVSSGYGAEVYAQGLVQPDYFVPGLTEVATVVDCLIGGARKGNVLHD